MGRKFRDITGQKFGRLTAIETDGKTPKGEYRWKCRCECGEFTTKQLSNIVSGATKSCGCYNREKTALRNTKIVTTHGHTKYIDGVQVTSGTYRSWQAMKQRCYRPRNVSYQWYGGRGITICERWINSFETFLEDMGERPDGTSIDRIDNDGNYEPGNCRWATPKEQIANQRRGLRLAA